MRLHHLFDDPAAKQVVFEAESNAVKRMSKLTQRERQVLWLVAGGSMNKTAAFELGISKRTIENHRLRLMEKTGVKNLAELIKLAILAGE